jgi:hypothetical protein
MFLKNCFRKDVSMLLLLGLVGGILLFVVLMQFESCGNGELAFISAGICAIGLFFALVLLPCIRYDIKAEIVAFNEVSASVERAREGKLDVVERAALTNTVIGWNIWLAKKQYRNAGFWNIYIPDEVDSLKKLL